MGLPADPPPLSLERGARAQLSVTRLSGRLLEQPGERWRIVDRLQRVSVHDVGQMGQYRGRVQRVFLELDFFPMEPVRAQPSRQRIGHSAERTRRKRQRT